MNQIIKRLSIYFQLGKGILSLAIAFSAVVGFYLNPTYHKENIWLLFTGVLFLSMSASALNQIIEREKDAIMSRTKKRPLPSKKISLKEAYFFVISIGIAGSILLGTTGWLPMVFGIFNLFLYAFVYTPLKYKNQFALLVGGLVGAIPPLIGWYSSGAIALEISIGLFSIFMFLWQVPHFFILSMKYQSEYQSVNTIGALDFSESKTKVVFAIWLVSTTFISFMFCWSGIFDIHQVILLTVFNAITLITFAYLLFSSEIRFFKLGYLGMHIVLIFHFILLINRI